jgi:superfamily II DNA/RNA helicase
MSTPVSPLSRDEIAGRYFDQLPFTPYPFQEEALLAWFSSEKGVLVCAPTGTGKTLIAEAALFEALHTGTVAYYTTPLIALTDQKFREMQELAVRWGFRAEDVGLVTGNRRENPGAPILVVVAEILFNRLLHAEAFDFDRVSNVVIDEFHNFSDPERGIVWEFTLGLLPPHVRTLLLSATVGSPMDFVHWLRSTHRRGLELVHSETRKVPLIYAWVPDRLLTEQVEEMAAGAEADRKTPALVFCFNREECWNIAEQLKGKRMLAPGQQALLGRELEAHDWSQGAGPKLKQMLLRGVGVHHAGLLPKYRRIVEELFQRKLLSVAVCTETLSAGINLPARSVVVPSILKGPHGKMKILDPSSAHQMFGRAGRPQYDTQGYVYVMAHEDDVKIGRWKEKFDRIPEDTKDPGLLKMKKDLKRKMPTRRATEQYWNEAQFQKLRGAPPVRLVSRGRLPWRLLAHMLDASPEVDRLRRLVQNRLTEPGRHQTAQQDLEDMLLTLWRAGYVTLEPEPPKEEDVPPPVEPPPKSAVLDLSWGVKPPPGRPGDGGPAARVGAGLSTEPQRPRYEPKRAVPTPSLRKLLLFRGVNPLYGVFLVNQLGIADRAERVQAMESVLELPRSIGHFVRVPKQSELPPGPLATLRLDEQLLRLGLATEDELVETPPDEEDRHRFPEERHWVLTLAEKLRRLFDYDFPGVHDLYIQPAWAAGELLEYGGDFNKYVTSKGLQKQEGIIFRHLLRLILLLAEFTPLCPPDAAEDQWRGELEDLSARFTETCRRVDPTSTEKVLEEAEAVETALEAEGGAGAMSDE